MTVTSEPVGAMALWQQQGGRAAWSSGPPPVNANVAWAADYGREIKAIIERQADRAPRSNQLHLGPSELGEQCDMQVVSKMVGPSIPEARPTNHVPSPWPSIIGTAVHAWLAQALTDENARIGVERFLAELRVAPVPEHPGTTDLFDTVTGIVGDHKVLGESTLAKIMSPDGPPRKYKVQLLLYWLGCLVAGLPARRIALIAYPRTSPTLDKMYVWGCEPGPEEIMLLQEVIRVTAVRRQIATEILKGTMRLSQVPVTPDPESCFYCFSGETEVVTRDGIKPIRELAGTSPELLVPTITGRYHALQPKGNFVQAPVRWFGTQRLWKITLTSRRAEKTIYATAEHRWKLVARESRASSGNKYGRIIQSRVRPAEWYNRTTQELKPGDRLRSLRARPPARAKIMHWAVAQGFVYGDGAKGQGNRPATLPIYDNGKDEALLPFFPFTEPVGYPAYQHDDGKSSCAVRNIYGLPRFWKDLPPVRESRTFLLSWLAGYFAADGDVTKAGQCTLCSADEQSIRFARDVAAVCGIGYSPIKVRQRMGTGTELTGLWTIHLRRRDLPAWFFLIKEHAIRAAAANEEEVRETYWSVKSVELTSRIEPVYCATVPGTEMFGLADDLLTGNCPIWRPQSARDGGPGCPGTSR